jgi:hypothetical protein
VTLGSPTRVGLIVTSLAVVGIGLLPSLTQSILDWTLVAARSLIGTA